MKYIIYFLLTISLQAQIFLDGSPSTLSASDIDAGNIVVGTADTQQVVISVDNRYVTVSSITTDLHLTETESDSFIVTAGTDYSFGIVLDTDTLGAFSSVVIINSGALNNIDSVTITWDVVYSPQILADTDSLDFDTISVYSELTLTLTNNSITDLFIDNILGNAYPFEFQFNGDFYVNAGESREIVVYINPTEDSTYNINKGLRYINTLGAVIDTLWINVQATVELPTDELSTPTSLAINDSTDGITLDWANVTDAGWYNIYRSTDNSNFSLIDESYTSNYTDLNIVEALRYYYKVSAENTFDESSLTSSVNAKSLTTSYTYGIYIDSSYASTEAGTYTQPYNSLSDVNFNTLADNTVVFIKGGYSYVGGITMIDNDATESEPILITSYGSTERYKLIPYDYTSTTHLLSFGNASSGSSYFTLQNAEIISRMWVDARKTSHATFDNCLFRFYSTNDNYEPLYSAPEPFYAQRTSNLNLTIKNSIFIGGWTLRGDSQPNMDDLIGLHYSSYWVFENNYIRDANHVLLGTISSSYGVVRNNRMFNSLHANMNNAVLANNILFENNYFERAGTGLYNGGYSGSGDSDIGGFYLDGHNHIFRWNLIRKSGAPRNQYNYLPAFDISTAYNVYELVNTESYNTRVYNNNFDNNYTIGMRLIVGSTGTKLENISVFNNSFTRNGDATFNALADSLQIMISDYSTSYNASGNSITYNYFGANEDVFGSDNTYYDATQTQTVNGTSFSSNIGGTPDVYESPNDSIAVEYWQPTETIDFLTELGENYNPNSNLRDIGKHLATVTANSTDNTITVSDPYVFFDGFGMVEGDSIVITSGSNKTYARITSVTDATSTLTLNKNVTVSSGDYVDVINEKLGEFAGSGIDIGMFEYKETIPQAPVILATNVIPISNDSARIELTFKSNNALGIVYYKFSNDSTSLVNASYIALDTLGSSSSNLYASYIIDNLVLSNKYYYQFKVVNSVSTVESGILNFTHNIETDDWDTNLLASYNYGFEGGNTTSWTNDGATSIAASTEQVATGTYSGKVIAPSTFTGIRAYSVSVTSGKNYKVSFKYYISTAGKKIYVDDYHSRLAIAQQYTTTGSWQSVELTVTASGTGIVTLGFWAYTSSATFYIDDVSIQEEL